METVLLVLSFLVNVGFLFFRRKLQPDPKLLDELTTIHEKIDKLNVERKELLDALKNKEAELDEARQDIENRTNEVSQLRKRLEDEGKTAPDTLDKATLKQDKREEQQSPAVELLKKSLSAKEEEARDIKRKADKENETLRDQLQELRKKVEEYKKEDEKRGKEEETRRSEAEARHKNESFKLQHALDEAREKELAKDAQLKDLEGRLSAQAAELERSLALIRDLQQDNQGLDTASTDVENALKEKEAEAHALFEERNELAGMLDVAREEVSKYAEELMALAEDWKKREEELHVREEALAVAHDEVKRLESVVEDFEERKKHEEQEMEKERANVELLKEEVARLEQEIDAVRERRKRSKSEVAEKQREIDAVNGQLQLVREEAQAEKDELLRRFDEEKALKEEEVAVILKEKSDLEAASRQTAEEFHAVKREIERLHEEKNEAVRESERKNVELERALADKAAAESMRLQKEAEAELAVQEKEAANEAKTTIEHQLDELKSEKGSVDLARAALEQQLDVLKREKDEQLAILTEERQREQTELSRLREEKQAVDEEAKRRAEEAQAAAREVESLREEMEKERKEKQEKIDQARREADEAMDAKRRAEAEVQEAQAALVALQAVVDEKEGQRLESEEKAQAQQDEQRSIVRGLEDRIEQLTRNGDDEVQRLRRQMDEDKRLVAETGDALREAEELRRRAEEQLRAKDEELARVQAEREEERSKADVERQLREEEAAKARLQDEAELTEALQAQRRRLAEVQEEKRIIEQRLAAACKDRDEAVGATKLHHEELKRKDDEIKVMALEREVRVEKARQEAEAERKLALDWIAGVTRERDEAQKRVEDERLQRESEARAREDAIRQSDEQTGRLELALRQREEEVRQLHEQLNAASGKTVDEHSEIKVAKKAINDALQKVRHNMAAITSSVSAAMPSSTDSDELSSTDEDGEGDETSSDGEGSGKLSAGPSKEKESKKERRLFFKKGDLLIALIDNQGVDLHEAELAFANGDAIEVVEQLNGSWCAGRLRREENGAAKAAGERDPQSRGLPNEAKQLEKARSKLAKIRRQTVGLSKDEFKDKIVGKRRISIRGSIRKRSVISARAETSDNKEVETSNITRYSSVAESVDKAGAEARIMLEQLQKQFTPKSVETVEEAKQKLEKRARVAQELLETERSYVFQLGMIVQLYLTPLRSAIENKKEIVSAADIKNIFGGIEVIHQYNSALLTTLEQRIAQWSDEQTLADIFSEMTVYLKAYNPYISSYGNAMDTIDRYMGNSAFVAFQNNAKRMKDSRGLILTDLLIIPIQRIPRYVLLLQEIARSTPTTHRDFHPTLESLAKVKQMADKVNDYKREVENSTKVLTIQQAIIGKLPKLFAPHRRFVREGKLSLLTGNDKKAKSRYCFLFNDLLLVVKRKKEAFSFKRCLFTKDIQLQDLPDVKGSDSMFEIVATTDKGSSVSLRFSCPQFEEKMAWMKDITNVLANRISVSAPAPASPRSFSSSDDARPMGAPAWAPASPSPSSALSPPAEVHFAPSLPHPALSSPTSVSSSPSSLGTIPSV